jgi:thiamine-monophosphate kinase
VNEFELIARLTQHLPTNEGVVVGAGDDCAVLHAYDPDCYLLLKTDAVVEGVHFNRDAVPEQIGHKALGRCLSDVAAMAGTPRDAVVTLGLPAAFEASWAERLYEGLNALARRYSVAIVGGETVQSPDRCFLSVAVLGSVLKDKCILRSGARAGDALFLTGELGGSLASKHLTFEPRVREAHWLAEHFALHAMIDLSDGLASDLRHILEASKVGAEVLASALPISHAARLRAKTGASKKSPLLAALTDGEDFELLFTSAPGNAVRLLDTWKQQFPHTRLTCIGKVTPGPGVVLKTKEGVQPLSAHGYVHFS